MFKIKTMKLSKTNLLALNHACYPAAQYIKNLHNP